ncbi:mechanosensitive ion channel domain-containing protein [Chelativorans sp. AA-79]|uniref:mechanosensitive ion channel domain-containing protein n=1 Tax=Chelativorans sp. AA-79 TaxID=3028735 RepID=UPI0023F692C0|nr:mechanosensitive ion channel domain-containing protein [Chelativorans sp. AA-79]WEX09052.1 mechanosensitive ion channel [Chelativorans sp. AA-79]
MPTFLRHVLLPFLVLFLITGPASPQTAQEPVEADPQPGYGAIADILEDEAARNALISELRRLAAGEVSPAAPETQDLSLARQIANTTNDISEEIVSEVGIAYDSIMRLDIGSISSQGMANLARAAFDLGVVILVVLGILWLSRMLVRPVYRRASDWVLAPGGGPSPWLKRYLAALGCGMLDLLIVAIGWVAGYAVAIFLLVNETGRMDTSQSLFLNAFLAIETAKVVIRLFFATRYDGLRLLPIRGEDAAYWNTWLSRLTSFVGYGVLVVVPIVNINLGTVLGSVVAAFVYGVALILAVVVIRQNREPVRMRLQMMAERSQIGFASMLLGMLARIWHIVMIAYVAVLALLLLLQPETALSFMIGATIQTVAAIAAGILLSALIDRAIALGIRLKPEMRSQFPMLEERLNAFVPTTLKIVRIVITLVVAAVVLDAWQVFDFFAWISSESGLFVIGRIVTIALVLAAAFVIWLLVSSWIEYRLNLQADGAAAASRARQNTLLTIFRNAFTVVLVVMALMITLSELGIDIGPLLAGAGVLGLAIGFGAQKLVQDVITGVFIQLENAIYTGDVVTAAGTTGVVEKLTIRSLGIRDLSGTYHVVPFSSVDTVSNFMRGFSYHVGEYGVAYRENIDEVIEVMKQAFEELRANPEHAAGIIGDLDVHGVTALADSSVNVRIRIKTLPGQQWAIGRAYNAIIKKHFDAAGIEIPFPHVTLYFGEDKKGSAPAAPIKVIQSSSADVDGKPDDATLEKPRRRKASRKHPAQSAQDSNPDLPSDSET